MLERLSITQRIVLSFLALIFIGSSLLSLPIMHYSDAPATSYLDHLFNTVSMVCVTGLSVFPVAQVYNGLGQSLVMILIQIGGLGLVTLIALSYYALKLRVSIGHQSLLQSALSKDSSKDLRHYLFTVYKLTLAIEGLAALLLMIDFVPRFGWANGVFNSIFLAVSAFCNAGFDNLGSTSMIDYAQNPLVNLVLAFLIVAGGFGFANWMDLIKLVKNWLTRKPRNLKLALKGLSLQTRLVLKTTGLILLFGTLISWLLEMSNPATIGNQSFFNQGLTSFFQTVTMRTAGFATISYSQAEPATNLLYMVQMIIGGAPGGTAGGIKVTVAALTVLLFRAELKGQSAVTFAYRTIPQRIIKQTLTVLIFFFLCLAMGFFLLLMVEKSHPPFALLFEAISALATVGVSMDLTSQLSTAGRFIIMALMFIGRVGPITVLLSLGQKPEKLINYAKADLLVG